MNNSFWENSVVTESLSIVLKVLTNEDICYRRGNDISRKNILFSYNEDFEYLWNLNDRSTNSLLNWSFPQNDTDKNIILVWDKIPNSKETTINIEDYLTPYDWALAFSLHLLPPPSEFLGNINKELPNLRIYIIDISSKQNSDSFGCKVSPMFLYALPWVTIYSASKTDHHKFDEDSKYTFSTPQPIDRFYVDLIDEPRNPSIKNALANEPQNQILKSLVDLWRNNIINPKSRHNVANLIAPKMLISGFPKLINEKIKDQVNKGFQLRNALFTLVNIIDLFNENNNCEYPLPSDGLILSQKANDLFLRRNNIKILLIDDQYLLGYQHFVGGVLFGIHYDPNKASINNGDWIFENGSNELRCSNKAEELFDFFETINPVSIKNWGCPRLLNSSKQFDILLLDLRLWANSKERKEVLERIINICERLNVDKITDEKSDLFDPLFKKALEKAKFLVSDKNNNFDDTEAISLFPLLLSYYDPSLPIVLFSSTHQRAILEMVSHRPNIITDFTKPILSGFGEENNSAEFVERAVKCLNKAIDLHEARIIWIDIVNRINQVAKSKVSFSFDTLEVSLNSKNDNSSPILDFQIEENDLINISLEYINTILNNRYADSFLAPDNWFENIIGGKISSKKKISTEAVCKIKFNFRFPEFCDNLGNYEDKIKNRWSDSNFRAEFRELIKKVIKDEGIRTSCLYLIDENGWNGEVSKNEDELKKNIIRLKLSGLVPQKKIGLIGKFLENNPIILEENGDWLDWLKCDIDLTLFSIIRSFRNLRAHYCVKPEESIYLKDFSIWLWIWSLLAIFPLSNKLLREGDLIVEKKLQKIDYVSKLGKNDVSFIGGVTKDNGINAVKKVMIQLLTAINEGWIEVDNQMIKNALKKLAS